MRTQGEATGAVSSQTFHTRCQWLKLPENPAIWWKSALISAFPPDVVVVVDIRTFGQQIGVSAFVSKQEFWAFFKFIFNISFYHVRPSQELSCLFSEAVAFLLSSPSLPALTSKPLTLALAHFLYLGSLPNFCIKICLSAAGNSENVLKVPVDVLNEQLGAGKTQSQGSVPRVRGTLIAACRAQSFDSPSGLATQFHTECVWNCQGHYERFGLMRHWFEGKYCLCSSPVTLIFSLQKSNIK